MKSILISIKPKYVAKILNGEKTIEIRKTMPKCDLPIDVYIYCTKDKDILYENVLTNNFYLNLHSPVVAVEKRNGKVVAKFTLNKVEYIEATYDEYNYGEDDYATETLIPETLYDKSCVSRERMFNYLGFKGGYAWHISNLVIFDKPKELSEFYKFGKREYMENYKPSPDVLKVYKKYGGLAQLLDLNCEANKWRLTKAPQSFMFVDID